MLTPAPEGRTKTTRFVGGLDFNVTHDYTYDATLVLGKAKEEQLMRDAIVSDLVRIVMKQISAI